MVRGKFVVTQINIYKGSRLEGDKWIECEGRTIYLSPVMEGSKENEIFGNASPCGKIEISILNPDAFNQFEWNKEYYVDFTKAGEN